MRLTTLFDLYRLPDDFPGIKKVSTSKDSRVRIEQLERAMAASIDDWRFMPYLQRHEFEALVLAALDHVEALLGSGEDLDGVRTLRESLKGLAPEDVNDGEETAPLQAARAAYTELPEGLPRSPRNAESWDRGASDGVPAVRCMDRDARTARGRRGR